MAVSETTPPGAGDKGGLEQVQQNRRAERPSRTRRSAEPKLSSVGWASRFPHYEKLTGLKRKCPSWVSIACIYITLPPQEHEWACGYSALVFIATIANPIMGERAARLWLSKVLAAKTPSLVSHAINNRAAVSTSVQSGPQASKHQLFHANPSGALCNPVSIKRVKQSSDARQAGTAGGSRSSHPRCRWPSLHVLGKPPILYAAFPVVGQSSFKQGA